MKKVFFTLLFLIISSTVMAGGFKTEEETLNFADTFMAQIVLTQFQAALNSAKPHWPLPEIEIDGMVNQIQQQWPIVDQRFGSPITKELVKVKRIGKSFLRYYYLQKFENHSIYWQIDFYKPRSSWMINQIIFLDNLEPLFE